MSDVGSPDPHRGRVVEVGQEAPAGEGGAVVRAGEAALPA
jgi:hypothetical protein